MWHRKAFAYVVRSDHPAPQLIVARCHHKPGFEVPRGTIEPDETPEQGARREVVEESGLQTDVLAHIGVTYWENEEQFFFLLSASDDLPDSFAHTVTGDGGDSGKVYEYHWLDINADLYGQLVEGGNAFVSWLLDYFPAGKQER